MGKGWEENFDALLVWLDADRDRAGAKYEEIRESLISIFSWRGFRNAEDLTDETISRVAAKVDDLARNFQGDPKLYFYAVAKKLFLETYRRQKKEASLKVNPLTATKSDDNDPEYECLEQCLKELAQTDCDFILDYYQQERPKINRRRELAKRFGLSLNGMRVKAFRIRNNLHSCIEKCLSVASE